MNKFTATLLPQNRHEAFDADTLLIDILAESGVHVPSPCGGKGLCGKCAVKAEGSLSEIEQVEARFADGGMRLSCRARGTGDITIHTDTVTREKPVKLGGIDAAGMYAVAVDIGTTSIQASLVNLANGESHLVSSSLNPQRRYGHDVITRISASSDRGTHTRLVSLLRDEVSRIIRFIAREYDLENRIPAISFSGNTVMTYYLLGYDVQGLGLFPYRPDATVFEGLAPADLDLPLDGKVALHVNPAASGFLGGDLVGGLSLLDHTGKTGDVFFIDLGTNGEMFLRTGTGSIAAASCAMGPALEGMNISSGMTAAEGAISHFRLAGSRLIHETIGNIEPLGISGTGIIDLAALLLRLGAIDASGRLLDERAKYLSSEITGLGWNEKERCVVADDSLSFTRNDIRNLQLAKGASLSAARLLLRESAVDPGSIKTVVVAGAFGEHLYLENFRSLNFLPNFENAEYQFIGNSSLRSAELSSMDGAFREKMKMLREKVSVVELNTIPDFNDVFIKSLEFGE